MCKVRDAVFFKKSTTKTGYFCFGGVYKKHPIEERATAPAAVAKKDDLPSYLKTGSSVLK